MGVDVAGVATGISDQDKIAAIRAAMPAVEKCVYLNTGTNGPLPRVAYDALLDGATSDFEAGRVGMAKFEHMFATMRGARAGVARLLGCADEEIALTHNTTEGMNIALLGLGWQPGDEVITSSTEHPGGLHPLYVIAHRYGVKIRMTRIGAPDVDPVEELRAHLTTRTRAVMLSHVSWTSGMELPMRALSDLAHAAGALVICDAAQSGGMVPANVYALGVDAYACSGQKWLCGPDGTGALFVRRDRLGDIHQTYAGYPAFAASDHDGYYVPTASAQRFEAATIYPPTVAALRASLDWIESSVGWEWAHQRIARLGRLCYDTLAALPGVSMYTPKDNMAGLVHFTVDGIAPADVTARLAEGGVMIRHTPFPQANRVSTGFYNSEEDIDRLARAITGLREG